MSDHITQPQPGTPALDYEAAKDYFFHKMERDRFGKHRMDSALYHTAQWIFLQGCSERDRLLAEINTMKAAHETLLNNAADAHERIAELEARYGEWKPIDEAMPPERVVVIVTDCVNSWPAFHEDNGTPATRPPSASPAWNSPPEAADRFGCA